MKESFCLVKLGGAALEDGSVIAPVCQAIARAWRAGYRIALVHGGGPSINRALTALRIPFEFRGGSRVTTPEMMAVIARTLQQEVSPRIVEELEAQGCRAAPVTGSLLCRAVDPELGRVGWIERVRVERILRAAESALPVLAPIGVDEGSGELFNINADWAASRVASSLGARRLAFVTDQDGILGPCGRPEPELEASHLQKFLDQGVVQGGMRVKTEAILHALEAGAESAHVLGARAFAEGFPRLHGGTRCRAIFKTQRREAHAEA